MIRGFATEQAPHPWEIETEKATDKTVPCVSFTGTRGKAYGLSLDHLNPYCRELVLIQDTQGPLHLYQPSIEHLATWNQVQVRRSKGVHLHALKFGATDGKS